MLTWLFKKRGLWVGGLFLGGFGIYSVTTSARSVFDSMVGITYHRGPEKSRKLALTFDDGPLPIFTERILQILAVQQVQATFFMIGKHVEQWPDIAREVAKRSHTVGNHTYSHPLLPFLSTKQIELEISKADQIILKATGQFPKLARPPHGFRDVRVLRVFRELGHPVVMWSVSPSDWANPGVNSIVQRTMNWSHRGAIVLLHDGMGGKSHAMSQDSLFKRLTFGVANRSQTVDALPIIIDLLRAKGYDLVTVPELLGINPNGCDLDLSGRRFSPSMGQNCF
jgi:peptidoglycan/xylan/chitin deacetylase (PgdA/CDA1 family)